MSDYSNTPALVLLNMFASLTDEIEVQAADMVLYESHPTRLERAELRLQEAERDLAKVQAEILRRMGEVIS